MTLVSAGYFSATDLISNFSSANSFMISPGLLLLLDFDTLTDLFTELTVDFIFCDCVGFFGLDPFLLVVLLTPCVSMYTSIVSVWVSVSSSDTGCVMVCVEDDDDIYMVRAIVLTPSGRTFRLG